MPGARTPVSISGVVVTYNSDRYLEECLDSMRGCDELLVMDLGSEDSSFEIASRFKAKIVAHSWVSTVEEVRWEAVQEARHEWVCFADPDMILPSGIIETAKSIIQRSSNNMAILRVAYQNYFQGHPVRYGRWGGTRGRYPLFMNKGQVSLSTNVHKGVHVLHGADESIDPSNGLIEHYWCESWRELLEKCSRYLPREQTNPRPLPIAWILGLASFLKSYLLQRGFLEGMKGLGLSIVAGWYSFKLARPNETRLWT